ncbi:unnamed protein product, partial [Staurois parvus]
VSPAASPAISSGRCRLLCSGPCDVGTYGRRWRREILKMLKKNVIFFKTIFHSKTLLFQPISHTFCPYALSCALPAFCLFFLPGN